MSTITVSIAAPVIDDVPTPATSAKLRSEDGTYGVRRADTEEVVVAAGTNLTLFGGDTYQYSFEGDDELAYEVAFELVIDGETYRYDQTLGAGEGSTPNVLKVLRFCVIDSTGMVELESPPLLQSPGGDFGLQRVDTGQTIIEAGTAFGSLSETIYGRSFEYDESARYRYYVYCEHAGVPYYIPSITGRTFGQMLAVGRYTNSYRIGQRFGYESMHMWLNGPMDDLDDPVDYARRAYQFIEEAENWLDSQLIGSRVSGAWEATEEYRVPDLIVKLATEYAGCLMYEARGVEATDEQNNTQHKLRYIKREIDDTIRKIKLGLLELQGSAAQSPITYPEVADIAVQEFGSFYGESPLTCDET